MQLDFTHVRLAKHKQKTSGVAFHISLKAKYLINHHTKAFSLNAAG
jgi:hypothetical protein